MVQGRPKFDQPPVVETALSVQFGHLPGYSTAHAGWFWKEYLEKLEEPSRKWSQAADAPRIEDQFERFGAEDIWIPPFNMRLMNVAQSQRSQFIRSDGERMIQLQDSRFILNWRKQSPSSQYPSYELLLPEFRSMLRAFEAFSVEAGFGSPAYNQWEIVYVDQIKKGDMWESARDLGKIFPGLSIPPVSNRWIVPTGDETVSGDWRFSLAEKRGRMYISMRQLRLLPSNEEILNLTCTARGAVTATETWEQGFEIGHEVLGETFFAITSPEAHAHWKMRS
jgi:uncharacterized protein (TIGR04255 family)